MDRKTYNWAKRTGREAYEQAVRDAVDGGGGGDAYDDTALWEDQQRQDDYMDEMTEVIVQNQSNIGQLVGHQHEGYASSNHTHSSVPSHSHNYASSSHSHNYASSGHGHDYAASNHSHSVVFRSGTSTNPSLSKGEPYLNTSYKVIYVGT